MKKQVQVKLKIERLNEKGYGVAFLDDREYWVVNSIPGEELIGEVIGKKKKRRIVKPIEFVIKSKFRKEVQDEGYISNSPWQIMDFELEMETKKLFIKEWFQQKNLKYDWQNYEIFSNNVTLGYRNKAEFSFYLDEDSFHLGLYRKDSKRGKMPVKSTILLPDSVNEFLANFVEFLNQNITQPRELKGVMIRYSFFSKQIVAVLFVKNDPFEIAHAKFESFFDTQESLKGLVVAYSDYRSPAFRVDKELIKIGESDVCERLNEKVFEYAYDGFFQVNPVVFEETLKDMRMIIEQNIDKQSVIYDIYSGVGTIGISLADLAHEVICIEIFKSSKAFCEKNMLKNNVENIKFIEDSAENAIGQIEFKSNDFVVVDPPRSGLHQKVIEALNNYKPKNILYLSCNPISQVENISLLEEFYEIKFIRSYNFYPNTPHIENLVWLQLKTGQ